MGRLRPYTKQYRLVVSRREMMKPTDDDVAALPAQLRKLAPPDLPEVEEAMLEAAAALEQLRAQLTQMEDDWNADVKHYVARAEAAKASARLWEARVKEGAEIIQGLVDQLEAR